MRQYSASLAFKKMQWNCIEIPPHSSKKWYHYENRTANAETCVTRKELLHHTRMDIDWSSHQGRHYGGPSKKAKTGLRRPLTEFLCWKHEDLSSIPTAHGNLYLHRKKNTIFLKCKVLVDMTNTQCAFVLSSNHTKYSAITIRCLYNIQYTSY